MVRPYLRGVTDQARRAKAQREERPALQALGHGCMALVLMRGAVPIVVQSVAGPRRMLRRTGVRRRDGHAEDYRQHQRQN